jgi:hypothetical protein
MHAIFGIDPGKHVGVLRYELETRKVEMGVCEGLEAAGTWLERRLKPGDVCSVERYNATSGSVRRTFQPEVLEVIGTVRWLAYKAGATYLIESAAEAKKIATTDVLKALGWWRTGDPDHVRRAAAQGAFALFRTRPELFEELAGPGVVM